MIEGFPPVEDADEHGLLAVGGDLEIGSLVLAYRNGIFPWPPNREILAWFAPPERAVLFFDELHVSRSTRRQQKENEFTFTVDRAFRKVITACAKAKRSGRNRGSWITPEVIDAYVALNGAGFAHSIEAWKGDELAGGVYGVGIKGMFAAESMFFKESGAGKLALLHLIEILKQRGMKWVDVQVLNPFTESLGARAVPREEFMRMLKAAVG